MTPSCLYKPRQKRQYIHPCIHCMLLCRGSDLVVNRWLYTAQSQRLSTSLLSVCLFKMRTPSIINIQLTVHMYNTKLITCTLNVYYIVPNILLIGKGNIYIMVCTFVAAHTRIYIVLCTYQL